MDYFMNRLSSSFMKTSNEMLQKEIDVDTHEGQKLTVSLYSSYYLSGFTYLTVFNLYVLVYVLTGFNVLPATKTLPSLLQLLLFTLPISYSINEVAVYKNKERFSLWKEISMLSNKERHSLSLKYFFSYLLISAISVSSLLYLVSVRAT